MTIRPNAIYVLLSILAAALGCGAARTQEAPQRQPPGMQVSALSELEGQALTEIMRSPTEFILPFEENRSAWQRTQAFFEVYLGEPKVTVSESLISNRGAAEGRFVYEVSKAYTPSGIYFSVRCFPSQRSAEEAEWAARNARNLARFIQTGTLERSLLVR